MNQKFNRNLPCLEVDFSRYPFRNSNTVMIASMLHRDLFKLRLSSRTGFIVGKNYHAWKFLFCPIIKCCQTPVKNFSTESSPNIRADLTSHFKTPNLGRYIDKFIEENAASHSSKHFALIKLIDSFEAALNNVNSLRELKDASNSG